MLHSKVLPALTSMFLALLMFSGCSRSSETAGQGANAKLIQGVENALEYWKEMEESGGWKQMIDEGVASDAIDNNAFLTRPEKFPAFKIAELEKRLAELKKEPVEP